MNTQRRSLLLSGGAVLGGLAGGAPSASTIEARPRRLATPAGGAAEEINDAALVTAFAKARYALDDRLTLGWVDANTYALIDGVTYPLYRLWAGTWVRMRRIDDLHFTGRTLETAYFFDPVTDELLTKLTMPVTGMEVAVKPYRAGPSKASLGIRDAHTDTFRMSSESRDGATFFREGRTQYSQRLSQPRREADDFYVRDDMSTRVTAAEGGKPNFFYSEWTITRANWHDIHDPNLKYVDSTLQYSAVAAFRPWMKMDGVEGHTVQNGRGGRARVDSELPPRFLEMVRRFDPDLLDDPIKVLGELP